MTNVWIRSILLTTAGLWFGSAGAQQAMTNFQIKLRGQNVGSASYAFVKSAAGTVVNAQFEYVVGNSAVSASRQAQLGPDGSLVSDTLEVKSGQTAETARVKANPATGKLDYSLEAAGIAAIAGHFGLRSGWVILNNFDPSGLQELLLQAGSSPQPEGKYTAFLEQGKGIELPATLHAETATKGTMGGKALDVQRWTLTVGGLTGQVLADAEDNLLEFAVPAQGLSYVREGFKLMDPGVLSSSDAVPLPAGLRELNVSFRSDDLQFPATFTLPQTHGASMPIVVMVQGSGPEDADATFGPVKVFRDLAWGLAQQGIATLRYPKRTYFAPQTFTIADVDHEVTRDAVAALGLASTLPGVDPHRVFLLGHSLGGMMAPVIATNRLGQQPGSVRGIVFLSASAEPFQTILMRQMMLGTPADQQAAVRSQWEAVFQTMNDPTTPADRKVGIEPLLAPESYWRSLMRQDPAAELSALKIPALVLHGTMDTNVFIEDYNLLAKVNTAPGSVNRQLDGLTHLFVPGGREPGRDASRVAPEVVSVIAGWVQTLQ